jgi:hypothetical protein
MKGVSSNRRNVNTLEYKAQRNKAKNGITYIRQNIRHLEKYTAQNFKST